MRNRRKKIRDLDRKYTETNLLYGTLRETTKQLQNDIKEKDDVSAFYEKE